MTRLLPNRSFALNLYLFPIIAGGVMGIPIWLVLRGYRPNVSWWWILVGAIGTAVQFPGMVMGGVLVWLIRQTNGNTSATPDAKQSSTI